MACHEPKTLASVLVFFALIFFFFSSHSFPSHEYKRGASLLQAIHLVYYSQHRCTSNFFPLFFSFSFLLAVRWSSCMKCMAVMCEWVCVCVCHQNRYVHFCWHPTPFNHFICMSAFFMIIIIVFCYVHTPVTQSQTLISIRALNGLWVVCVFVWVCMKETSKLRFELGCRNIVMILMVELFFLVALHPLFTSVFFSPLFRVGILATMHWCNRTESSNNQKLSDFHESNDRRRSISCTAHNAFVFGWWSAIISSSYGCGFSLGKSLCVYVWRNIEYWWFGRLF